MIERLDNCESCETLTECDNGPKESAIYMEFYAALMMMTLIRTACFLGAR